MRAAQKGVGMIEVLVSILILAIGVLGYSFLQMRAIDASAEATNRLQAMNLARDLSERIRSNSTVYSNYQQAINADNQSSASKECIQQGTSNPCTRPIELAAFDVSQIKKNASVLGMSIKMPNCQTGSASRVRKCIYVAWGNTKAIDNATQQDACTNSGSYLPKAQCIVMELY